jgi:hypothetical protein
VRPAGKRSLTSAYEGRVVRFLLSQEKFSS